MLKSESMRKEPVFTVSGGRNDIHTIVEFRFRCRWCSAFKLPNKK